VTWPGFAGIDLLGPAPGGGAGSWVGPPAVPCAAEAWEAARIEAGVPVSGREIVEGTIAAEVGLVERTVSFTKGCFTGQELVARLDARGSRVARSLCAVVVGGGTVLTATSTSVAPPVGAEVWTSDGEHLAGALSSVAWSPDLLAAVGLATLHRRVVPPEAVSVRWTGGDGVAHELGAEARPLPLVG
jgi:folate-binding protein YgfZ